MVVKRASQPFVEQIGVAFDGSHGHAQFVSHQRDELAFGIVDTVDFLVKAGIVNGNSGPVSQASDEGGIVFVEGVGRCLVFQATRPVDLPFTTDWNSELGRGRRAIYTLAEVVLSSDTARPVAVILRLK